MAAEILCVPSLGGESFGMVLLEAMAARTVVVASDIDGYRQAAGGHAVLVPPGDGRSLAEALSGVLSGELAVVPAGREVAMGSPVAGGCRQGRNGSTVGRWSVWPGGTRAVPLGDGRTPGVSGRTLHAP